ncbi:MAG: sugar phosphate isomerase/epimerase [Acidobacteria bacterium]|nr:sugar phosphate isomerase/epimerase [Acidobacteriota bacterium]
MADLSKQEKDHLLSEVKRLQHVSTHLPFHGLRPATQDRAARKATLDLLHRAIDDSGFWGARVATVHAAPEPNMTYEQIWPDLLAVFRELGDHAAKYKIRLAIETGSPNTVKQYLALIREIGHDFVGGCVDTGHTRAYRADIGIDDSERATAKGAKRYNDILMEKVEGLGPKLFHFHFDDVRPADLREHRTLGTGLVDWDRLLRYLAKVGYAGTFAVELEETPPVDELVKSRLFYQKVLREIS